MITPLSKKAPLQRTAAVGPILMVALLSAPLTGERSQFQLQFRFQFQFQFQFIFLEELRPGMACTGKTIVSGDEIETFQVRPIDIIDNPRILDDHTLIRAAVREEEPKFESLGQLLAAIEGRAGERRPAHRGVPRPRAAPGPGVNPDFGPSLSLNPNPSLPWLSSGSAIGRWAARGISNLRLKLEAPEGAQGQGEGQGGGRGPASTEEECDQLHLS